MVLGADNVEQNVDDPDQDLTGTGAAESARLQEWELEKVGLGVFHMTWSTQSCLGWPRCLYDPPRYTVVECMSLENIVPVALQVEGVMPGDSRPGE